MAESHLDFTKPSHVVGRYALYGRLAAGGMATVHLGRVLEADGTSRTVAVKRLHPQFCKDPEFVAMFIDEARLAARIKHPNVVETLDILTMGQELLLVMEYIPGECFSKLLRAARRRNLEPSIGVVGRIASGMLHGLHAAHEARDDRGELLNVVHRDISPQNVMIDAAGGVKVLDFGVAKASARIQITRDGQMKGKLSYMSPEQLQGLPVDRRADVFACGVVLWEALTRRRLFVGEDASDVLRKILRDEVPPPSQWMPGLSLDVDRVVLRALSKDPEQRYQTAEELALDVERIMELAPPAEVGQWLDSVAGDILGKRERLLQEIERLGVSDLSFDPSGASAAGQGSITDSDTFQRIQSWAEREAARVVVEGQSPQPMQLEDPETEHTKTVADARCVEEALPPPSSSGTESAVSDRVVKAAEAESSVTQVPDPAFFGRPPPLPRGTVPLDSMPIGTASGMVAPVAPRRERRFMYMLAAAAVVLGVGALTVVIGVPPSTRVRTSALLPESAHRTETNDSARDLAVPTKPVADTTDLAAADVTPRAPRAALEPTRPAADPSAAPLPTLARGLGARAPSMDTRGAAAASTLPAVNAASDDATKARVSEALTLAPRERVQPPPPPPPKRATRRPAVARRAKPAAPPTATASAAKPANGKVDCRQPFWIDEGGIRRLKMACL